MKIVGIIFGSFLLISIFSCNNQQYTFSCEDKLIKSEDILTYEGRFGDITSNFNVEVYKTLFQIEVDFQKNILDKYQSAPRTLSYYVNETPPSDEEFYNLFLNDDDDLYLLEGLLETLRSVNDQKFDIVELIVAFVQSIPYDSYAADVKYPYETLAFNKGDCDEKSILLCKLLYLQGYNACLFVYEEEKHMAVGLKVADQGYYKDGYVFIESTNTFPIGEKGRSADNKLSNEEPVVLFPNKNSDGFFEQYESVQSCYKEINDTHGPFYLKNDIYAKSILDNIRILEYQMDSINSKLESIELKLKIKKKSIDSLQLKNNNIDLLNNEIDDYNLIITRQEPLIINYNHLVQKINGLNAEFNSYNEKGKSPNTITLLP